MRRLGLALLTTGLGACAGAPAPPSSVPAAAVEAPEVSPAPPPPVVSPPVDPGAVYRDALQREVTGAHRLTHLTTYKGVREVRLFVGRRRHDGVLFLTLSLNPPKSETTELLTRASRPSRGVSDVLLALLELQGQAEAAGTPWRGYQSVQLPEPVRGLQYFDLVPAGEARPGGARVRLLRVLPLTQEEFERATSEQGGQWAGAAGAELEAKEAGWARWAPAEVEPEPEAP